MKDQWTGPIKGRPFRRILVGQSALSPKKVIQQPVIKESSWRQLRDPNPLPPWARPSPDTPGTTRKKKESHGKET